MFDTNQNSSMRLTKKWWKRVIPHPSVWLYYTCVRSPSFNVYVMDFPNTRWDYETETFLFISRLIVVVPVVINSASMQATEIVEKWFWDVLLFKNPIPSKSSSTGKNVSIILPLICRFFSYSHFCTWTFLPNTVRYRIVLIIWSIDLLKLFKLKSFK